MNSGASNFAEGVDKAFYLILGTSVVILIGITTVMIYFLFKYNKKRHPKADTSITGNNTLEIIWTVIPTMIVLVMFYYGWAGFAPMRNAPKEAIQVKAIARMWSWSFEYSNGKKSDKLIVPDNRPVKINLTSLDVIHGFYVPAFRVKEDAVPGRNNMLWFTADQLGSYDLFCSSYCGLRHSYMVTTVEVVNDSAWNAWMKTPEGESNLDKVALGFKLMKINGCVACHSSDGTKLVSTSFKDMWGKTHKVITGGKEREVLVDADYIKRSVYEPNADVVVGYKSGLMPSFKGQISDDEVSEIVAYIKSLGADEK